MPGPRPLPGTSVMALSNCCKNSFDTGPEMPMSAKLSVATSHGIAKASSPPRALILVRKPQWKESMLPKKRLLKLAKRFEIYRELWKYHPYLESIAGIKAIRSRKVEFRIVGIKGSLQVALEEKVCCDLSSLLLRGFVFLLKRPSINIQVYWIVIWRMSCPTLTCEICTMVRILKISASPNGLE